ncbi:Ankyrin repeat domain-containing protein 39 [Durusdinium trenchii]|uniref:Ankyrin repeat domain-containing protein 39 n=1 Tax=Durusdinium trenchii TaxID=1381693 RepID=A0ABP0MG25_9DINO
MQVTAVFGNMIAQLDEDEMHYMVESGQSVRDLKRRLSAQVGCSRFQQRLFSAELAELEDDLALPTLSSVQLVILPLSAPDDTMNNELLASCEENNLAHIENLLQKPMDPNQGHYLYLIIAAQNSHSEVVRLLLEAGADKDAADTDGSTAVHTAAKYGHLEVVRLLHEAS